VTVPATGPFRFCPNCGREGVGQWREGREFRCSCGFRFFQNVAAACGALVSHRGKYLFVERARDPAKGKLGLPGGFVDPGESIETALAREVGEEIGGRVENLEFLASFPNRYPFAGIDYHTCDLYFRGTLALDPGDLRADPGEVAALRWLAPDEVRPEDLAFDSLRQLWASLPRGRFSL
jgi:ADP-ribose pyrophosphatase YjhB (NUDIX family)